MLSRQLKKLGVVTVGVAALCGASAAMAKDYVYQPIPDANGSGYYIEGYVGYGTQDYHDAVAWQADSGVSHNNGVDGGATGGFDLGYNLNHHFGVEFGWFYLPSTNVAGVDTSNAALDAVYINNWAAYIAAKYMTILPWTNQLDWFFKLGAEYRRNTVSTTAVVQGISSLPINDGISGYVRPMFATGLDYRFNDVWSGIFEYAYFMGNENSFPITKASATVNAGNMGTLDTNVFLLGVAYRFVI